MSAAADLTGDGIPDVVTAGFTGRNISVVTADASGTLTSHTSYIAGDAVLAVDLGDLDADGDLDVVTSNLSSNDFTIFENDGSGNLSIFGTLASSSAGSCAILHDRDNDGDIDITGIDETDDVILLYSNPNTIGVEGLVLRTFVEDASVNLLWSTSTENNNAGFDVQRQSGSVEDASNELWETIGFVPASGSSSGPRHYSYTDKVPFRGLTSYRLRQVDTDGSFSYSNTIQVSANLGKDFSVSTPYPNPFSSQTVLEIEASSAQMFEVTLIDIAGRTVKKLTRESVGPGTKITIELSGDDLPSGLYFFKIKSADSIKIIPVTLTR